MSGGVPGGGGLGGAGGGGGGAGGSGNGLLGGNGSSRSECLVFVNSLEVCSKFVAHLKESLARDAAAAFGGRGNDEERVMSCLQELGATGALFARAASDCLEEVCMCMCVCIWDMGLLFPLLTTSVHLPCKVCS